VLIADLMIDEIHAEKVHRISNTTAHQQDRYSRISNSASGKKTERRWRKPMTYATKRQETFSQHISIGP
jgi:hypothetical protein